MTRSMMLPKRRRAIHGWLARQAATLLAILVLAVPAFGQNTFDVISSASTFRIEGTSTVNRFACETDDVSGRARLDQSPLRTVRHDDRTEHTQVSIKVPVRSLDCGKSRMNEDLFEALQADSHPAITYELRRVELTGDPQPASGGLISLRAEGILTIAGASRAVTTRVTGHRYAEGVYRVKGSVPLRMSDFGVQPPTALLGLIKANDDIEVHFDLVGACELLIAQAEQEGLSDWQQYAHVQDQPDCVE